MTNAIKYTNPNGDIGLTLGVENDQACLCVRDSGAGIPAEKIDEIFQLFYQSDETLERSNGGMGVGLTLVQAVVELHGGSVTAKSDGPGQGSLFSVSLPLSNATPTPNAQASGATDLKISTIVLVDDLEDARQMLASLLKLEGFEVHEAGSGTTGLALIQNVKPDAAIIDIGLPEMDGHEVARTLRADPEFQELPLIALTGYGQDADRRAVKESGFDLHLVKPLNPEQLTRVFAQLDRNSTVSLSR